MTGDYFRSMNIDTRPRCVDSALLRKTLEHITAHPHQWDQEVWVRRRTEEDAKFLAFAYRAPETECGTAYCLAGYVALADGRIDTGSLDPGQTWSITKDGVPIDVYARDRLGLTLVQADRLFNSLNDLYSLWGLAAEFTADGDDPIEIPLDIKENDSWS